MTAVERVARALEQMRLGRMVILVDDEDRENEGDLVLAAEKVTPDAINFMATYARGLICLAMDDDLIDRLELPMMVRDNQASLGTAFTVSIEARHGVSTGISAKDRATTVRAAIAENASAGDVVSPGHIFPLRARKGGVLVRTGQTEGSVDLARLAGLTPAGVICEIMREDGEMARLPELEVFAERHQIQLLSVADIIAYRLQREHIVRRRAEAQLRPGFLPPGELFTAYTYDTQVEDTEYLALVRGDVAAAAVKGAEILVRVAAADALCDPLALRPELEGALRAIDECGVGVFLYVVPKSRTRLGAAFDRFTRATTPTVRTDTSEALRDFGLGAQVLADLGCRKIRLLSNSDRRVVGIEGFGIEIVGRVPIPLRPASRRALASS
jgi:3,4-dihydroxy 2-butanone 4-phosphate synthase / GTP cyclohydrolase II